MKQYKVSLKEPDTYEFLLKRDNADYSQSANTAQQIVDDVKSNGKSALVKYADQFGEIKESVFAPVNEESIKAACDKVSEKFRNAVKSAFENIYKFHKVQQPVNYETEIKPGVVCGRKATPINDVGLYIPGGTAPLPSTVLMLGIPSLIAGCKRRVMISPGKNGVLAPEILYAANYCGIDEIYPVGGAHGIAMLAYGIEGVNRVSKIYGPGNSYVTSAKMFVNSDPQGCAIDMPAGPSEVLIIADENANPSYIASDFLSQLEHGNDSQAIMITNSPELCVKVKKEIETQSQKLTRSEFIANSLEKSIFVVTDTIEDAIKLSNIYAPEHLIINTDKNELLFEQVTNAGSVFLGEYSPESAGDYASGTNHSLPTGAFAKSYSGIGVENFMKFVSYQKLTKIGLENISEAILGLAEAEGLDAHANAVRMRINGY